MNNLNDDTKKIVQKLTKTLKMSSTSILMIFVILISITNVNFALWINSNRTAKILINSIRRVLQLIYSNEIFILIIILALLALLIEWLMDKTNSSYISSTETTSGSIENKGPFILFLNLKNLFLNLYGEYGVYYLLFLLLITNRKGNLYTNINIFQNKIVILSIAIINVLFLLADVTKSFWSITTREAPKSAEKIIPLSGNFANGIYITLASFRYNNGKYSLIKDQYYLPKVDKWAYRYYIVFLKDNTKYIERINGSNNFEEIKFNFQAIKNELENKK